MHKNNLRTLAPQCENWCEQWSFLFMRISLHSWLCTIVPFSLFTHSRRPHVSLLFVGSNSLSCEVEARSRDIHCLSSHCIRLRQARKKAQGCNAAVLLPTGPLLALAHVGTAGSLRRPRTAVAAGSRVNIDHWSVGGHPMTAIDSGNNQVAALSQSISEFRANARIGSA